MHRRSFLIAVADGLLMFGSAGAAARGQVARPKARPPVRVRAVSAKTNQLLKDARVFVLSKDGHTLAEAVTNELGIAELPSLSSGLEPKYVFVDAPWYFVTGRRWEAGLLEYDMRMLGLTPPGFMG